MKRELDGVIASRHAPRHRCGLFRAGSRMALVSLLGLILVVPALSDTRELEVGEDVIASADYFEGKAGLPAVLILHGFLQTRQFPTVSRMTESLAELDYTVLAPTLSLGISRRRQSQPCEALHLNKLSDDVAEIALWVEWLHRETGRPVVIVAHSAAAHTVTRLLHDYPETPIESLLLISPGYLVGGLLGPEPSDKDAIAVYALEFCPHYPTTPEAFHSHVRWGPEQMLETLERAGDRVSVIIGTDDERLSPRWVKALRDRSIDVTTVQGADHFFASSHEFELLDEIILRLNGHPVQ